VYRAAAGGQAGSTASGCASSTSSYKASSEHSTPIEYGTGRHRPTALRHRIEPPNRGTAAEDLADTTAGIDKDVFLQRLQPPMIGEPGASVGTFGGIGQDGDDQARMAFSQRLGRLPRSAGHEHVRIE
jgi:hypothetical protein